MKDLILEYIEKKKELLNLADKIEEETGLNFIELPGYIQVCKNIEKFAEIFDVEIKTTQLTGGTEEKYFYINETRILQV